MSQGRSEGWGSKWQPGTGTGTPRSRDALVNARPAIKMTTLRHHGFLRQVQADVALEVLRRLVLLHAS